MAAIPTQAVCQNLCKETHMTTYHFKQLVDRQ